MLRILVLAVCVTLSVQSCCMPSQWEGQVGYQSLWIKGASPSLVSNAMYISYDAINNQTYVNFNGQFPFLPGVASVISNFNTNTYWMTMEDSSCGTGPFTPVANTMPMCVPEGSPAYPYYMGFDVSATSYDVSGGSPTVTSYINTENPTCVYLSSSTVWNNSWGTGLSVSLQLAFQNLQLGISNPGVFDPPSGCSGAKTIEAFTSVAGLFKRI